MLSSSSHLEFKSSLEILLYNSSEYGFTFFPPDKHLLKLIRQLAVLTFYAGKITQQVKLK
jgi:hypothetical protein